MGKHQWTAGHYTREEADCCIGKIAYIEVTVAGIDPDKLNELADWISAHPAPNSPSPELVSDLRLWAQSIRNHDKFCPCAAGPWQTGEPPRDRPIIGRYLVDGKWRPYHIFQFWVYQWRGPSQWWSRHPDQWAEIRNPEESQ
jgi:hypothetical protein